VKKPGGRKKKGGGKKTDGLFTAYLRGKSKNSNPGRARAADEGGQRIRDNRRGNKILGRSAPAATLMGGKKKGSVRGLIMDDAEPRSRQFVVGYQASEGEKVGN